MLVPVDVLFLGDTELWKCLTWAWVSLLLSWGHVGLAWERKVMGWKVEFGSRAHECESFRCSVVSTSLQPCGLQPARLLCPWDSPGKNTGMGCHFLLQGIFPTQGWNTHLLHLQQVDLEGINEA